MHEMQYFVLPNQGRESERANKFSTPGPLTDEHGNITGDRGPIVSMVGDNKGIIFGIQTAKVSPFFKEL